MQTDPELGLTERAATRIIDLLLDRPGLTEESRRSPDSVMSFEPLAIQPTTVAASAASAASAAAAAAAAAVVTPPPCRPARLRPSRPVCGAPSQPFLPVGAPIGEPRSAPPTMGRPPLESRPGAKGSHLAPLSLDDGRRPAATRRAPFAGLQAQGSGMPPPSWASHRARRAGHSA